MRVLVLMLVAVLTLSACVEKEKRVFFDGKYFPAKAKHVKGDRQSFSVSVRKAGQSLTGAREAGRHAGVRHCIENFGTSEIDWSQGPDAEDGQLILSGGSLILKGKCVLW